MSKFYTKLAQFRDKKQTDENYNYSNAKIILNQLLTLAFNNESEPDNLPNVFYLTNINILSEGNVQQIMEDIGYSVEVVMINKNWICKTSSFKVTLK